MIADPSAVRLGDPPRQVQAQSAAATDAAAREALKQSRFEIDRHARATVGHLESHRFLTGLSGGGSAGVERHLNATSLWTEFDGILEQVLNHAAQIGRIAEHGSFATGFPLKPGVRKAGGAGPGGPFQIQRFQNRRVLFGLEFGDQQHRIAQCQQILVGLHSVDQGSPVFFGQLPERPLEREAHVDTVGDQRRAHVVAEGVHQVTDQIRPPSEFVAVAFEPLAQLGAFERVAQARQEFLERLG